MSALAGMGLKFFDAEGNEIVVSTRARAAASIEAGTYIYRVEWDNDGALETAITGFVLEGEGNEETTTYTVNTSALDTNWTVAGVNAGGYEAGATVTITLTQKTAADMPTTHTVTVAGVTPTRATVTTAGVAAKDAVKESYDPAEVTADNWDELKATLFTEADGTYTAVGEGDSFAENTTYYTHTEAQEAVAAQPGVITITFAMPSENVTISGVTVAAAEG